MKNAAHARPFHSLARWSIALGVWAFLAIAPPIAAAQGRTEIQVFPNSRLNRFEMLCHIEGGVLRIGTGGWGEVVFSLGPEGQIYSGLSRSRTDLTYTVRDNQLVTGESYFSDDIRYTWEKDKIFTGDSRFRLDLAFTLRPVIFQPDVWALCPKDEASPSDYLAVIQGYPTPQQLFAILLTLGLI